MKIILKKPLWFTVITALCLVVVTLFAAVGCEKLEDSPTNENNGNDSIEISDTIIILKMNETFVIPNNNDTMTVSFVEVSDDRCQKSMCHLCYGSKASILLSVTNSESANVKIELSIVGCIDEIFGNPDTYPQGKGIDTLGYKFQLFKLSPYPDVEAINKNDYITKIKITKL